MKKNESKLNTSKERKPGLQGEEVSFQNKSKNAKLDGFDKAEIEDLENFYEAKQQQLEERLSKRSCASSSVVKSKSTRLISKPQVGDSTLILSLSNITISSKEKNWSGTGTAARRSKGIKENDQLPKGIGINKIPKYTKVTNKESKMKLKEDLKMTKEQSKSNFSRDRSLRTSNQIKSVSNADADDRQDKARQKIRTNTTHSASKCLNLRKSIEVKLKVTHSSVRDISYLSKHGKSKEKEMYIPICDLESPIKVQEIDSKASNTISQNKDSNPGVPAFKEPAIKEMIPITKIERAASIINDMQCKTDYKPAMSIENNKNVSRNKSNFHLTSSLSCQTKSSKLSIPTNIYRMSDQYHKSETVSSQNLNAIIGGKDCRPISEQLEQQNQPESSQRRTGAGLTVKELKEIYSRRQQSKLENNKTSTTTNAQKMYFKNKEWLNEREKKLSIHRNIKAQTEVKLCPFKPILSEESIKILKRTGKYSTGVPAYDKNLKWKSQVEQNVQAKQLIQERKIMEECLFEPRLFQSIVLKTMESKRSQSNDEFYSRSIEWKKGVDQAKKEKEKAKLEEEQEEILQFSNKNKNEVIRKSFLESRQKNLQSKKLKVSAVIQESKCKLNQELKKIQKLVVDLKCTVDQNSTKIELIDNQLFKGKDNRLFSSQTNLSEPNIITKIRESNTNNHREKKLFTKDIDAIIHS